MSYSRWSHSDWYIFWHCESGETKDEQVLAVWLAKGKILNWSYGELLDMAVGDIQKTYECDLETAEECMMFIKEFIDDVDDSWENK
jgi:hypothetical protein